MSQSLSAWSSTQTAAATASPIRVKGPLSKSLLRGLGQGFPFAQRLGVARRHVRVVGIAADRFADLPGARAFAPLGARRHHRDAAHLLEPKGLGRALALDQGGARRDADLGEVDAADRGV